MIHLILPSRLLQRRQLSGWRRSYIEDMYKTNMSEVAQLCGFKHVSSIIGENYQGSVSPNLKAKMILVPL